MNGTVSGLSGDGEDNGKCELLGPFALFVQGALGALALLSLVWKRARENPQRPLLIWWFDVSKQVIGSILVHIANLLLSMLSSGQFTTEPSPKAIAPPIPAALVRLLRRGDEPVEGDGSYHSNPCSFYLLNLGIDTTIGIFILIVILRMLHRLLLLSPWQSMRTGITSGEYGDPPKWTYFGKQALVYFAGLMGMKFVVFLIFQLIPWLGQFGDWLLKWTEGDKRVQVFFVMFFFPLVMNALQYYIIDSYIKAKVGSSNTLPDPDAVEPRPSTSLRHSFDDSEDIFSDDDDDLQGGLLQRNGDSRDHLRGPRTSSRKRPSSGNKKPKSPGARVHEYNPETDGANLLATSPPDSASSSFRAIRSGKKPTGRKASALGSGSRAGSLSSMMLLPGSRGPSTPGYREEDAESRELGSGRAISMDDEATLVGKESDLERDLR